MIIVITISFIVINLGNWNKLEKKHCWFEKLDGSYTTVEAAKLACSADPKCTAVYDQGCDAGANDIYLCGAVPNGYTTSARSCIYEKPKGTFILYILDNHL